MNEIDVLVNAGLSRTNAEMTVALYTMATTLTDMAAQQQQHGPESEPPTTADAVPTPDIPPSPFVGGTAVVHGEVIGVHDE